MTDQEPDKVAQNPEVVAEVPEKPLEAESDATALK